MKADVSDIKVGDYVKATHREQGQFATVTGKVTAVHRIGLDYIDMDLGRSLATIEPLLEWEFEVLEPPLPPVEPDLIAQVKRAFNRHSVIDNADWIAVINTVRKFDSNKKESSK